MKLATWAVSGRRRRQELQADASLAAGPSALLLQRLAAGEDRALPLRLLQAGCILEAGQRNALMHPWTGPFASSQIPSNVLAVYCGVWRNEYERLTSLPTKDLK